MAGNRVAAVAKKQLGNAAFGKKQHAVAIEHYTEAIELDPTDHVFWANRAAARLGLKQHQEAAGDAREALRINPSFVKASFRLATALNGCAEHKEAVKALISALQTCADKDRAKLQTALSESREAESKQADEALNQMTPLERWKEKGNRAYRAAQFEDAIEIYTRGADALTEAGDIDGAATVINNRSACHKQLGNHERVIDDCSIVLVTQPSNLKALIRRGQAYEAVGKIKPAYEDMNAAFMLDSKAKVAADARHRLQQQVRQMDAQ